MLATLSTTYAHIQRKKTLFRRKIVSSRRMLFAESNWNIFECTEMCWATHARGKLNGSVHERKRDGAGVYVGLRQCARRRRGIGLRQCARRRRGCDNARYGAGYRVAAMRSRPEPKLACSGPYFLFTKELLLKWCFTKNIILSS